MSCTHTTAWPGCPTTPCPTCGCEMYREQGACLGNTLLEQLDRLAMFILSEVPRNSLGLRPLGPQGTLTTVSDTKPWAEGTVDCAIRIIRERTDELRTARTSLQELL